MAIRKAAPKDQSHAVVTPTATSPTHLRDSSTPRESVIANRDFKRRLTNVWANREASKWARRASRPAGVSGEGNTGGAEPLSVSSLP